MAGAALQTYTDQVVANRAGMLDTLSAAGTARLVAFNFGDFGVVPAISALGFTDAASLARYSGAIVAANLQYQAAAAQRGVPVVDFYGWSHLVTSGNVVVGGVSFDLSHFSSPATPTDFFADPQHGGTVAQGLIANMVIKAADDTYGADIAPLSDQEILQYAGITPPTSGPTYFDVDRFVISPSSPSVTLSPEDRTNFGISNLVVDSVLTEPGPVGALEYHWSLTRDGDPYAPSGVQGSGYQYQFPLSVNGVYKVTLAAIDPVTGWSGSNSVTVTITDPIIAPRSGEGTLPLPPGYSQYYFAMPPYFGSHGEMTYPQTIEGKPWTLLPTDAAGNFAAPEGREITLGGWDLLSGFHSSSTSWSVTRNGSPYTLPANTVSGNFLLLTPDDSGTYVVTRTDTGLNGTATASVTIDVTDVAPSVQLLGAGPTAPLVSGLDPSFGADGSVATNFDGFGTDFAGFGADGNGGSAVYPETDPINHGKIVIGEGYSRVSLDPDGNYVYDSGFVLARYLPNGNLDPTFGTAVDAATGTRSGSLFAQFAPDENETATRVAIAPDGKVLVLGNGDRGLSLARFTASGDLDTTFGAPDPATGQRTGVVFGAFAQYVSSMSVDSAGRVVVVGDDSGTYGGTRSSPATQ